MHKRTSHGIVDSNETEAVNNLEVEMTGKFWKTNYVYLMFLLSSLISVSFQKLLIIAVDLGWIP